MGRAPGATGCAVSGRPCEEHGRGRSMTDHEWALALTGHGPLRIRRKVAVAITDRARERQQEGRKDIAGRLRYLASEIGHGPELNHEFKHGRSTSDEAIRK